MGTNYHVIENAKGIYVCLQKDGVWKSYNAILVKDDPTNDLAIIKIDDKEFVHFLLFHIISQQRLKMWQQTYTPLAIHG